MIWSANSKFFTKGVRPSIVGAVDGRMSFRVGQSVLIETWTYETVESVETTLLALSRRGQSRGADRETSLLIMSGWIAIRSLFSVGQPVCKAGSSTLPATTCGAKANQSQRVRASRRRQATANPTWTVNSPTIAGAEAELALGNRAATIFFRSRSAIRKRDLVCRQACAIRRSRRGPASRRVGW